MVKGYDQLLSADQIRTIVLLAECGSFTKTAASLSIKQSAVTQIVGRIERKLGKRLFHRTPAGAVLTSDGEAVLIYSQAMLKLGVELQQRLEASRSDAVLRVGLTEDVGRTALPNVLGLFARDHANFKFEATCDGAEALYDAFDQDKLDVVIARRAGEDSRGEVLWTEERVWVGRADTPLPVQDPIPLVLTVSGAMRTTLISTLQAASRTWQVPFESANLGALEAAVRAGLGITAAPVGMALLEVVHLDAVASALPPLDPVDFVLERRIQGPTAAVAAFCDVLRTATRLSYTSQDRTPRP